MRRQQQRHPAEQITPYKFGILRFFLNIKILIQKKRKIEKRVHNGLIHRTKSYNGAFQLQHL